MSLEKGFEGERKSQIFHQQPLGSPICYIRRKNNPWTRGRRHHEIALHSYLFLHVTPLEPGQIPTGAFICADHVDGGQFYAYFSYVGHHVYQFLDQYGNTVQIMMETPSRIAHVNRITDC
jgi:hypothetical protein